MTAILARTHLMLTWDVRLWDGGCEFGGVGLRPISEIALSATRHGTAVRHRAV